MRPWNTIPSTTVWLLRGTFATSGTLSPCHLAPSMLRAVEPGHAVVLGPPPGLPVDSSWAIAVHPEDDGRTRLVSRVRARINRWTPGAVALAAVLDPGQFVMEKKFLLEVKKRAEARRLAA